MCRSLHVLRSQGHQVLQTRWNLHSSWSQGKYLFNSHELKSHFSVSFICFRVISRHLLALTVWWNACSMTGSSIAMWFACHSTVACSRPGSNVAGTPEPPSSKRSANMRRLTRRRSRKRMRLLLKRSPRRVKWPQIDYKRTFHHF